MTQCLRQKEVISEDRQDLPERGLDILVTGAKAKEMIQKKHLKHGLI